MCRADWYVRNRNTVKTCALISKNGSTRSSTCSKHENSQDVCSTCSKLAKYSEDVCTHFQECSQAQGPVHGQHGPAAIHGSGSADVEVGIEEMRLRCRALEDEVICM